MILDYCTVDIPFFSCLAGRCWKEREIIFQLNRSASNIQSVIRMDFFSGFGCAIHGVRESKTLLMPVGLIWQL